MLIAITGKGGVGKTTISSIIIKQLVKNGMTPVLAIDADPNSCLDAALGVKAEKTVGSAREEARDIASKGMGAGISKQDLLHMKIAESLVEAPGFDLIAMGRPEGAGCYCYANNVLKNVITEIAGEYAYVVLDNEAGLENLSRRIVLSVDILVLVSDPSNAGLNTLKRLHALANEMKIKYDKLLIIINRARSDTGSISGGTNERMKQLREETNADGILILPDDAELAAFAEDSKSFIGLPDDNATVKMIDDLLTDFIKQA